jgi:hypothetical protein
MIAIQATAVGIGQKMRSGPYKNLNCFNAWEVEPKRVVHPYTGKWLLSFVPMGIYMHLNNISFLNLKA